ncbi:hypothetical protein I553_8974 [Mycobacterium xenopi 4042]|uniref:Uncharacterized protein n=1 Tax=Mycobacterium xenopi 4042 TaxID=1299334 RepID=X8API7_MYCXE|nr:hypothetical protein I552_3864 [Mycobacterium xenopi 3993]EUA32953.1 hypothetical protein I553_8974 [Mycobacterium xenopi 4042]
MILKAAQPKSRRIRRRRAVRAADRPTNQMPASRLKAALTHGFTCSNAVMNRVDAGNADAVRRGSFCVMFRIAGG